MNWSTNENERSLSYDLLIWKPTLHYYQIRFLVHISRQWFDAMHIFRYSRNTNSSDVASKFMLWTTHQTMKWVSNVSYVLYIIHKSDTIVSVLPTDWISSHRLPCIVTDKQDLTQSVIYNKWRSDFVRIYSFDNYSSVQLNLTVNTDDIIGSLSTKDASIKVCQWHLVHTPQKYEHFNYMGYSCWLNVHSTINDKWFDFLWTY